MEFGGKGGSGSVIYGTDDIAKYKYNMIENPGPLADLPNQPWKNFYGGRYNVEVLTEDRIMYRGGNSRNPYGRWFASEAPESVVDTVYAIRIPKGTTMYRIAFGPDIAPVRNAVIEGGGLAESGVRSVDDVLEGGSETELFLLDEYYETHLPNQVTPGTKYLPKYDKSGNIKQIKMYDDYGREIGWVDYTNHGYGDINSFDYHTSPQHWHERIYNAQNKDGMKIHHRTDANTPLGGN